MGGIGTFLGIRKVLNPNIGTNTQYWYQYCCFPNYYHFELSSRLSMETP